MRIRDWSSDVCSSDLLAEQAVLAVEQQELLGTGAARFGPQAGARAAAENDGLNHSGHGIGLSHDMKIGRASCRGRVCQYVSISVVAVSLKKHKQNNMYITTPYK